MDHVTRFRVGLVLGAGGPVGHAFHAGVLRAIEQVSGWDARTAEVIIGTSAGAQVGALLRAGLSPEDLMARVTEQPLTRQGASIIRHYIRPLHSQPHPHYPLRLRPSAPRYLARVLRRPRSLRFGSFVASVLPEGRVFLGPQADGFRRLFAGGWPAEPLWIPATCLETGERVVFGKAGAPVTDVGTAVIASGSVPCLCVPVRVGPKRYIDGGFASFSHLDTVVGTGLDLVLVSSPLSRFQILKQFVRRSAHRVRNAGIRVLLLEPERQTANTMGWNPLDEKRMGPVAQAAFKAAVVSLEHDQAEMRHALEDAARQAKNGTGSA